VDETTYKKRFTPWCQRTSTFWVVSAKQEETANRDWQR
jgi:hypothetical protein